MSTISLPLLPSFNPRRLVVVGASGSGKTTMAEAVGQVLGLPHIELDALFWLPGWVESERPVFDQRIQQALEGPAWVVDGNYSHTRPIIWTRADTLVWLDYGLAVTLWRLVSRTLARKVSGELLWGTNRESLRGVFFPPDSLLAYAIRAHRRHRLEYPALRATPQYAHLTAIRLRSPAEGQRFLRQLKALPSAALQS